MNLSAQCKSGYNDRYYFELMRRGEVFADYFVQLRNSKVYACDYILKIIKFNMN
jgi:hypothetical protein